MTDLYPSGELASDNADGNWEDLRDEEEEGFYTADDTDDPWEARFSMDDPSSGLDGTQTVTLNVRGDSPTGEFDGDSEMSAFVYESGTQEVTLFDGAVITHQDYQEYTETFDATDVSNETEVEIKVEGLEGGGMPGTRDYVEVSWITWEANLDQNVAVTTEAVSDLGVGDARLNGDVTFSGHDSVDVWFEWRENPWNGSEGEWTEVGHQNLTTGGEFDHFKDNLQEGHRFDYRAHAESDDGTQSDTGEIESEIWTDFSIGGNVDVEGEADDGRTVWIAGVWWEELDGEKGSRSFSDWTLYEETSGTDGDFSADLDGGYLYMVMAEAQEADEYRGHGHPWIGGDDFEDEVP